MANENKGIALVILGIVAVIAIVGLILLFTQSKSATGQGIYGGAIKQIENPYWTARGVPRGGVSDSSFTYEAGLTSSKDITTSWNYYGAPKRDPLTDIPSLQTSCGNGGFKTSMNDGLPEFYAARGYAVVPVAGEKGAYACVYPQTAMLGGIAGQ